LPKHYRNGSICALSEEQREQAREMYAAATPVPAIADKFGVSKGPVYQAVRGIVWTGPRRQGMPAFNDEQIEEVRAMRAAGQTPTAIAATFGVHPQSVYRIMRRHGIQSAYPHARHSDELLETVRQHGPKMHAAGQTLHAIADTFGVSYSTVWRLIRRDTGYAGYPVLSDEQVEQACQMRAAGESVTAIATAFGITHAKVRRVTNGYGRTGHPRKLSDEQIDEVRRMRAAGETQQAIADKFGVTQATIWRVLQR
jgi:DNA invertase Pin-like site-specific DNA recombinase